MGQYFYPQEVGLQIHLPQLGSGHRKIKKYGKSEHLKYLWIVHSVFFD